jgi:predicted transglutaminase-like cysteine proteinase
MIKSRFVVALCIYAIGMRGGVAASAVEIQSLASEQNTIAELGPTLAPFQHVRFCLRYPADCQRNFNANESVELNNNNLMLLERINRRVNAAIASARKDYDNNVDASWTIAPDSGDCNDYATTKQHELRRRGFPSSALRLSVVKTADGDGHLVLVVTTINGELILDNLTNEIRPWKAANYRWLKIQSRNDPKLWVEVKSSAIVSAALKEAFRKMALESKR